MSTDHATTPPLSAERLAAFPLERWARIVASIDAAPSDEAAILAANEIDAATWEQIDAHWLDAQQRRLEQGDASLLVAADDAYLARLEEERGALTPDDVAGLVVAGERGRRDAALDEADIPEAASCVVERVWCRRCAADPTLSSETDAAVERARSGADER